MHLQLQTQYMCVHRDRELATLHISLFARSFLARLAIMNNVNTKLDVDQDHLFLPVERPHAARKVAALLL